MEQLFCLRFEKQGTASFLSHLDMARMFLRAFRRTKLPVKMSEGFHAHPKVRFSPPLSVGVESLCETCHFTLIDETRKPEELLSLLRETMPDGFTLVSLAQAETKAAPTTHARYEITFAACKKEDVLTAFSAPMTVIKKTKSGQREIDLFPHLILEDVAEEDENVRVTLLAPAAEELTINPNLILLAINEKNGTLRTLRILKTDAVIR